MGRHLLPRLPLLPALCRRHHLALRRVQHQLGSVGGGWGAALGWPSLLLLLLLPLLLLPLLLLPLLLLPLLLLPLLLLH